VRSLLAVDLWEISIVTFPLLAGARVRAVKQAGAPPRVSFARARAERDWRALMSGLAAEAPTCAPVAVTRRCPRGRLV
jgi:phage head maturation protease